MLTLLHGENQVASRLYVDRFKKDSPVETREGKSFAAVDLESLLQPDLFRPHRVVVIENPKCELFSSVTDTSELDIVLWCNKKLEKIPLKTPPWKVFEFKQMTTKAVYQFVDGFLQKNIKHVFLSLHRLKEEHVAHELVIGSLNKQLVSLISFKENPSAFSGFQQRKLQEVARFWETGELTGLLRALLELDARIKSGRVEQEIGFQAFLLHALPA